MTLHYNKNFLHKKKTHFRSVLSVGVMKLGEGIKSHDGLNINGERLRDVFTGVRMR
jgi:hypothetical protein